MAATAYPARERFFAHKFVRLVMHSGLANDIGATACLLLSFVAHSEDAIRYSGPAKFWNEQLLTMLGLKSMRQLITARNKAIDAGWLVYERPSGNRQVGRYFVTIPEGIETIDEDTTSGGNDGAGDMNSDTRTARKAGAKRAQSDKPSNPIPNPIPIPGPITISTSDDVATDEGDQPIDDDLNTATAIDPELAEWLAWWNRLFAERLVPARVSEINPSKVVLKAWTRVKRSREAREALADRDALEAKIRGAVWVRQPWFRLDRLLGGANQAGILVATALMDGLYDERKRDKPARTASANGPGQRHESDRGRTDYI